MSDAPTSCPLGEGNDAGAVVCIVDFSPSPQFVDVVGIIAIDRPDVALRKHSAIAGSSVTTVERKDFATLSSVVPVARSGAKVQRRRAKSSTPPVCTSYMLDALHG